MRRAKFIINYPGQPGWQFAPFSNSHKKQKQRQKIF